MNDKPSLDDPAIAVALEGLTAAAIDALPFGVIRLDREGQVLIYSRPEAEASDYGDRPALGQDFFRRVAPCLDTPDSRGRIAAAAACGGLDIELGHTGDFGDADRFIRFRVCSALDQGLWLLTQRD